MTCKSIFILLAIALPTAARAATIDTTLSGSPWLWSFGATPEPIDGIDNDLNGIEDDNQIPFFFGQTFTVPAGEPFLTSLSFYHRNAIASPGQNGAPFTAHIWAWDTTPGVQAPAGSALFSSGPQTTPADGLIHAYTFSGLSLQLTPGTTYVAFLSQSQFASPSYGSEVELRNADTYAGGHLVSMTSGTFGFIDMQAPWDVDTGRDASFQATFAVPEPGSAFFAGAGLALLVGWQRRRSRPRTAI